MKRWIHCETDNKLHIDPVSKTLVKPDIDIGGRKYDAEDQVAAIDYTYGYGSLPKARKAIVDGKYSEDDIKRSILYKETEGLPFKDRKEMYKKNLKKFGLDEEGAIESSTISDEAGTKFAIAIVDDKSDEPLGFLCGFRKGGFYHPGNVVQGTYDFNNFVITYKSEATAKRALGQYRDYSEVMMYDPTSTDYPQPSEKWKRKEVPTHLEVVPAGGEPIKNSTTVECSYDPYAIGGHLKHFLTGWAKECVETGHPVNDFTEFKVCLEDAGFDDLTEEEIDNGFEFYQDKIEEADRDIRSCNVTAATQNMSQCSFDFDLGDDYDEEYIDNELTDIFADFGAEITGTDYHSVDYTLEGDPRLYSQCTVDYVWDEPIDGDALEDAISELINDQGGNFLGLDVSSL